MEGAATWPVIYKELGSDDGFIITAFFTKKPKKRGKVWPK